jgi:hypothetical protein
MFTPHHTHNTVPAASFECNDEVLDTRQLPRVLHGSFFTCWHLARVPHVHANVVAQSA